MSNICTNVFVFGLNYVAKVAYYRLMYSLMHWLVCNFAYN